MKTVLPEQLRAEVYEALISNAQQISARDNLTRLEMCIAVTHGALDILDGGKGNRADGNGLPLLQLMVCPHPDFTEGRKAAELPVYDNSLPFNAGLEGTEYQTGIANDFAQHYEHDFEPMIRARAIKAAKELFG